MVYLDDGVLLEILVRLPAESLLRFRCVDRRWNSLISDPLFAKAQAIMPTSNTSQRLLLRDKRGRVSVSFEDLMNGQWEDRSLRLDGLDILCSCRGLLCLLNDSHRFVLYNPVTMTRRKLPRNRYCKRKTGLIRGLGYDTLNNDYKLVIGSPLPERKWIFSVFSLRSNSWRRIGGLRTDIQDWQGKYSNGFLHWLRGGLSGINPGIVSFDIATEQLHEDLLPMPVFTYPGQFTRLGVTQCGWLVIYCSSPNASEFWIMKDPCRGSNSTWTQLCYILDERIEHSYTLWFPWVRNGKIFLLSVLPGDYIGVYDPEKGYLKTMKVPKNHCPLYCFYSIPHDLNLLPPHV